MPVNGDSPKCPSDLLLVKVLPPRRYSHLQRILRGPEGTGPFVIVGTIKDSAP
jgi:hypothetical protein